MDAISQWRATVGGELIAISCAKAANLRVKLQI
jgi:hypothetical protein